MLKDAIILSKLNDKPLTKEEIANSMGIGKSNIEKSIRSMKRSGLVRGRGYYSITSKGRIHIDNVYRKISGY